MHNFNTHSHIYTHVHLYCDYRKWTCIFVFHTYIHTSIIQVCVSVYTYICVLVTSLWVKCLTPMALVNDKLSHVWFLKSAIWNCCEPDDLLCAFIDCSWSLLCLSVVVSLTSNRTIWYSNSPMHTYAKCQVCDFRFVGKCITYINSKFYSKAYVTSSLVNF